MGLYNVKKYNFKSYDCDEVAFFDIAFAVKEYIQNTQGQILKALEVRKWRDWERTDLSEDIVENIEKRQKTKERLRKSDPCLFAGDQGKAIARSKLCQPRYVLEATISVDEIRAHPRDHDLRAVIVLWGFKVDLATPDTAKALTVYNNYLDVDAKFSHFVDDGSSTSKASKWAVGLKGKGFILSTSFLAGLCQDFKTKCERWATWEHRPLNEECKSLLGMSSKPIGVGFNVGSRFCKGEYNNASPAMLQMKKEDLRPLSIAEFKHENPRAKRKDIESDDESDSEPEAPERSRGSYSCKGDVFYTDRLRRVYKRRIDLHLAESIKPHEKNSTSLSSQERPFVRDDDVCVHVIGLPGSLTAEDVFSAVFGALEEPNVWKIPGTLFEIFKGRDRFFHRDQLVLAESPLKGLSTNYHGELRLTGDRMEIVKYGWEYEDYKVKLPEALDKAMSAIPDLAALIMKSILSSITNTTMIKPGSKRYATEYKAAFEAACDEHTKTVYPFARRAKQADLIRELGYHPWPLDDWQMQILEDAGAYLSIEQHAKDCLLAADECLTADFPGFDCLNRCVRRLIPELKYDVSVRRYYHSMPKALYHAGKIVLAQPGQCKKCSESKCSCWVGPALVRIMREYDKNLDLETVFWVYNQERKFADEEERISTQIQEDNAAINHEGDCLQPTTPNPEIGGNHGLFAACESQDDSAGEDVCSSSRTTQDASRESGRDKILASGHGSLRQKVQGPKARAKNRIERELETPKVLQSISSPSAGRSLAAASTRSGGNALIHNTTSETPAMTTEMNIKTKLTVALESLVRVMIGIVNSAKTDSISTVHGQLTWLLRTYAAVIELAHQAQVSISNSGDQQDDGLLETTQNNKRKRTG